MNSAFAEIKKIELEERTKKAYTNRDEDPRGQYRLLGVWARGTQGGSKFSFKSKTGKFFKERLWLVNKDTIENYDSDKRLVFVGDKVYRKLFLSEHSGAIPETIWLDSSNAANASDEIKAFFGSQIFETPKPTPLISKILKVSSPSNSITLDFFAGSGTTGQAVMELNKEDGGNRQFILCTNNENNICTDVCYPRIRKVIEGYKNSKGEKIAGLGGNLKYYQTDFVNSEPSHRNKKALTQKSLSMLCIKENTFEEVLSKKEIFIYGNEEKYTAVLFDEMKMEEFKEEISKLKKPVSVYVFSLEGDDYHEEFEELKNDITLCSIPEAILKVYRRIYGKAQLKLKM